jgi:hypothetical protein
MTVRWIEQGGQLGRIRWLGDAACDDSQAALASAKANRDAIKAYLVDLNAARIQAYQNGDTATGQALDAQYAGQQGALNAANANVNAAQANVDKYCNPQPSGNQPPLPPAPCSASNPCPNPDDECVNGECKPKCAPGNTRDPVTGECVQSVTTAGTGSSPLGMILLVGAVIGAIWFAVQAPGVGR